MKEGVSLGPSHHQCVPGLLQLVSLLYHLPRSQCNPWHVPAEGSPQWFPICFGIKFKLLPKPCVIWPCPPQPLSVIVFLSVPQSLSSLLLRALLTAVPSAQNGLPIPSLADIPSPYKHQIQDLVSLLQALMDS